MQRDKRIDVIKGLAIVLMVLGHSGFAGKKFIYLFHMAVFFMVSGYLFKPNYEEKMKGIVKYIIKKIKGLWLPCFIWNAIYTLLNNVLINIHVYSDSSFEAIGLIISEHSYLSIGQMAKNIIKGVLLLGRTELGGAFWFLRTLFALSIFFCAVDYIIFCIIRNEKLRDVLHFIVALSFACIGYGAHLMGVSSVSIPVVLSSYILYYSGYMIKKYSIMSYVPRIAGCICGLVILLICTCLGPSISIGDNDYGTPIYLIVCAFSGWLFLYGLADLLGKFSGNKLVEYIGKNTFPIVIHHFWCFKIVHLLQIFIYGYSIKYLASFPYLNRENGWWLLYSLVGVALPILLELGWAKINKLVKSNKLMCRRNA